MAREFARNYFHRERLEYNEERDWKLAAVFKRRDVEASMWSVV